MYIAVDRNADISLALQVPAAGMGCWKISRDATAEAVVSAVKAGWRHFDCACDYGNEAQASLTLTAAWQTWVLCS